MLYKYSDSFSVMSRMAVCSSSYFKWYEFVKVEEF